MQVRSKYNLGNTGYVYLYLMTYCMRKQGTEARHYDDDRRIVNT